MLKLSPEKSWIESDSQMEDYRHMIQNENGLFIASIVHKDSTKLDNTEKANLHLILQAPLLLYALKEATHLLANVYGDDKHKVIGEYLEIITRAEYIPEPRTKEQLIAESGDDIWLEHPDYPMEDWRAEANDGDTLLGYWDWAEHKEAEKFD